ncbi:hypothetical protein GCM10022280_27490 [Sphingomonas swuensis]|uniref:DUF3617 family protein n=1 Tax=Sphingomonas swuensis TaxID=977800 RepID=A0ABP7TEQ1_9SPHN
MRSFVLFGAVLLAGCGQEAPKEAAKPVPATLPAGQYEVTTTLTTMASTDKTPLPTFAKQGDKRTYTSCGSDDLKPTGETADVCTQQSPYIRNGRMNVQLSCNRPGKGTVTADFSGSYTADGFKGTITSNSSFSGPGDYRLVEEVTARKVADQCTAPAAAPKA